MQQHWPSPGWYPPHQQAERVILEEPGVLITSARFVVGTATYPIMNLSAVRLHRQPASHAPAVVSSLVAALCLWRVFDGSGGVISGGVGLAAVAMALAAGIYNKDQFVVIVSTSGVNQQALITKDAAAAQRIVAALSSAIVDLSRAAQY